MYIHFAGRTRELANEKLMKNLIDRGVELDENNADSFKMTNEEFNRYFELYSILDDKDLKENWLFYTSEDAWDIIEDIPELEGHSHYDLTLDELLAIAKHDCREIHGFMKLSDDLYIIKE